MTEHLMVDLETLSTKRNAAILSIGAVLFDADGTHQTFYQAVRWSDDMVDGLVDGSDFDVSPDTLSWWEKQSEEARQVFTDPEAVYITGALGRFSEFIYKESADWEQLRVWGNGSDFDNVILQSAYDVYGIAPPWQHWNNRCYRTVKNQHPNIKLKRSGTYHNALDDAVTQAQHLLAMNAYLN